MVKDKALVLFSGGQDSATCLAWSLANFKEVETVGFDYGQRHLVELEVRQEFIEGLKTTHPRWINKIGKDHVLDLRVLSQIGATAMTQKMEIVYEENGLPNTFVPARNLAFLTLAASLAYRRGAKHLVIGVCETDYSGYPDCRDDTMKAMQVALNLGLNTRLVLHTPLMFVNKADTWRMAEELGGARFVSLVQEKTHSCYKGERETLHPWGYGCNSCPACDLRRKGYEMYCDGV
jgi:7-cyano-7-deazaguanine synthase